MDNSVSADSSEESHQPEFVPRDYLHKYFSGGLSPKNLFTLENLHKYFKDGELTGTMIDVGCGPTVHCLISASAYCDTIVCSDYTPANREQVKSWLHQEDTDFDWLPYFEYVATLETNRTVEEMQRDVRRKVKDVIHCDVRKPGVIQGVSDKFDIVLSTLCLEDATNNKEDYLQCLCYVIGLLKPGGTLLLLVSTNCVSYMVGSSLRQSANIFSEDAINFLIDLDFEVLDTAFKCFRKEDEVDQRRGRIFIRSRKCST